MKALVIGRHEPDFGDAKIEVIERQAITFEKSANLAEGQLWAAIRHLHALGGDALLFQGVPGQVTAALATMIRRQERGDVFLPLIGVVISVPGERPEETARTFGMKTPYVWELDAITEAVRFANPQAKVAAEDGTVTVTVCPPMRFRFSHIAWLTGETAQFCID